MFSNKLQVFEKWIKLQKINEKQYFKIIRETHWIQNLDKFKDNKKSMICMEEIESIPQRKFYIWLENSYKGRKHRLHAIYNNEKS